MLENINKNWISQENKEVWRETSIQALEKMKALEIKFQCTRKRVIEKTPFGVRIKYVKQI